MSDGMRPLPGSQWASAGADQEVDRQLAVLRARLMAQAPPTVDLLTVTVADGRVSLRPVGDERVVAEWDAWWSDPDVAALPAAYAVASDHGYPVSGHRYEGGCWILTGSAPSGEVSR